MIPPILNKGFGALLESFFDSSFSSQEKSPDNFSQGEVYPPLIPIRGLFSLGLFWLLACREPELGPRAEFPVEVIPDDIPKEIEIFLPEAKISQDFRIEGSGSQKRIWFNIEKKSSEDIVLRGYSFSPRTQSKNPDDLRFDLIIDIDGTITGRIKDARNLSLACQFKNNGPEVRVDQKGRITKVLSGTLAKPAVIAGQTIPAGYTVTNINFDESGNPFPDKIPSVCAYNIPSRGSCAFPTDGRLPPIPLNPLKKF